MSDELVTYLQVACGVCGRSTDLPAVWTCACGEYRLCYRSPCHMKIPASHRDGACAAASTKTQEDAQ